MSPLATVLNIAIIVAMLGIVVYWVRRFAVFRGYKDIHGDVLRVAETLKSSPVRERNDVVVAGYVGWLPTVVRFSKALDTPGLHIQMRVPSTFNLSVIPKSTPIAGEGRVLLRSGSTQVDKKFNTRSDDPMEARMLLGTVEAASSLEQLCCSTQNRFSIKDHMMELSEMTIPRFTANHVLDHLHAMNLLANRIKEMPGAAGIRVQRLPATGSGWTIRIALGAGLVCLVVLLFMQPYNQPSASYRLNTEAFASGVAPADAARLQQLNGWHIAGKDDFPGSAVRFLRDHRLTITGRIMGDFGGRGDRADSAYLLVNAQGERRVSMLAGDAVAYDAIFPRVDALARIPKSSVARIKWKIAPQFNPDGDALLVIENADDPTASLVLLRHGTQTYSARPSDFSQIDLALQ